jgi:predicted O-linked N-acetylglucosamine transferase (SPINDLY family)
MGVLSRLNPWRARDAARIDAHIDAGIAAFERGDLDAAQAAFDAAARISARDARAPHLQGVVALARGDVPHAEALIRAALALDAALPRAHFNLGNALLAQGRPAEAVDCFERACAQDPADFAARFNLGRARLELGRHDAAIAAGEALARLKPDDPNVTIELGTLVYRRAETTLAIADFDRAIALFQRALAAGGVDDGPRHNAQLFLGDALARRGRHAEALAHYQALLVAAPDDLDVRVGLANALNSLGRMRDAAPHYARLVETHPGHLPAISSAISADDYDGALSPEENTRRRFERVRHFTDPRRARAWTNPPDPDRRIRIGYVSPDFREHVAMALFEDVLARHDHAAFEVFCYDCASVRDARNRALRRHADHWREIDALGIDAACAMIRADGIDLLVDLAGHTAGNRLMLFARKVAPLQATWLAYPGSTGLPEIDWIVTDPISSPAGSEPHYRERLWRLPATRFTYTPPTASPAPRLPPAGAPITFCCFNNPSKLAPAVLALWRRILDATPGARLLLKSGAFDETKARDWMLADLQQAGIPHGRVTLQGHSDYVAALAAYGEAHIALDPFPFCGGLTTLDALWMGVPVITLRQTLMAGRQSEAFLAAVGASELVAAGAGDYVRVAVGLAGDPARLMRYREGMRERLRTSSLMDYAGFTGALEAAWRGMWREWCERATTAPRIPA